MFPVFSTSIKYVIISPAWYDSTWFLIVLVTVSSGKGSILITVGSSPVSPAPVSPSSETSEISLKVPYASTNTLFDTPPLSTEIWLIS